jgi:hypothetical protein
MVSILPPPRFLTWQYQEFATKPTPPAGINSALTWLNENIAPPDGNGTVFGNIDSNGDVRLFFYGYATWKVIGNEPAAAQS